jgi:hypothetical protein
MRPVAIAVRTSPTTDSMTTTRWAAVDSGYIAPYPMVPMVWTLKKKAWRREPSSRWATPPIPQ